MRRALWIVPLLAAAVGAAAHASSAAPARATSTTDVTYSCAVSSERQASLFVSATSKDQKHPAILSVTTGVKTKQENGATVTSSQLSVQAAKNGLIIDRSSCRHTKRIPLKPKGLPGPPSTVTASLRGYDGERCDSAARVVFRLRLTTTGGIPSHALVAIRNDNAKSKAIAFYNWSPKKITEYTGTSCSTMG
jgi:hypothetical protein